jgi:hypothetical protein
MQYSTGIPVLSLAGLDGMATFWMATIKGFYGFEQ